MKNIFKIGIITMVVILIIEIENNFKKIDIFNVSKIIINNVTPTLKKDIEKLNSSILGENINELNLEKIAEYIKEDIRVENVRIQVENINEIHIDITEKEGVAYVQYGSKLFVMDEKGSIFGNRIEYTSETLPLIVVKSKEEKRLLDILKKIEDLELEYELSQIHEETDNLIYLTLRDGIQIKTDEKVVINRYRVVSKLYTQLKKANKIEYVDIRFEDIYVKENSKKVNGNN